MKYIKIEGNLVDVLGKEARKMKKDGSTGILMIGDGQMIKEDGTMISYGIITDTDKFMSIMINDKVTIFESKEHANINIDLDHEDFEILVSIDELALDLQLSGNPAIVGYDKSKPLKDKNNLKKLKEAGMSGIKTNKKAKHFE